LQVHQIYPKKLKDTAQSCKEDIREIINKEIKKRMERRYTKYFKYWKDYEMLTCIFAMVGMILAIYDVNFFASHIYKIV
jgi:hypothetical protein